MPGALAAAQRNEPFGHESTIETDERYDVGDGAERDVVEQREQIRFRAVRVPEAARAQFAVDRHHGHEGQAYRGEMAKTGQIVATVRVDDGKCGRQGFVRLMVIEDHDID